MMQAFDQWQFPDGEQHLPKRMTKWNLRVDGRLTYQYPLYELAAKQCKQKRVAVDVGAHVGLMSYWMVRDFVQVIAFEPVERHRECWRVNVPARPQDQLMECALGSARGSVRLEPVDPNSTGGTHIVGPGEIPLCTLDSFELLAIDLLKIDCEGYEANVLEGAAATIARCRPVVAVEQRARQVAMAGRGPTDAVKWLQRAGASVVWTDKSDYVMVFP